MSLNLGVGRYKPYDMASFGGVLLCLMVQLNLACAQNFREVRTPEEFQDAVRQGVAHVVIRSHLNMVDVPNFSSTTIFNEAVISVVRNGSSITRTIRVRDWRHSGYPSCIAATLCALQHTRSCTVLPLTEPAPAWCWRRSENPQRRPGLTMHLRGTQRSRQVTASAACRAG
jgi:hypothetical protein